MIRDLLKYHRMPMILLFSCCALYFSFAYDLERNDFPKLLSLYLALAFLSWKLFQLEKTNLKFLLGASILFRLIFLFSTPNLSQDFYRFLWDGQLLLQGISPYLYTPTELMASVHVPFPVAPNGHFLDFLFSDLHNSKTSLAFIPFENANELISGMGSLSAGNHSNYPPLSQVLFALAALFSGKSLLGGIVILRVIILLAELGIYHFGRKLLKITGLPENRIFWFLLNPFIIIELTGNLHFEGVMIFFLLWSLYLLHQGKWTWSAIVFALSISVKLVPLLFLPLLFRYFKKHPQMKTVNLKKLLAYYLLVSVTCLLTFVPFLSAEFIMNYWQTLGLWFQKFEFNASIYYLTRWVGFQVQGYNIIQSAGIVLSGLVLVFVLLLSLFRKNIEPTKDLLYGMFWAIVFYYFLATTVHPWYLSLPLIISIFTQYKFALLWTVVVVLSYSAYSGFPYKEDLWLIAAEYLVVFGYLGYELIRKTAIPTAERK